MTATPPTYKERIHAAVAGRDPAELLRATPAALAEIVSSTAMSRLIARPFVDKWTPLEIITHLVDHEIVMAYRLRRIVFERAAQFASYPQETWIDGRRSMAGDGGAALPDPSDLIERFRALRADTLAIWEALPDERLRDIVARDGRHAETLEFTRLAHAGHDQLHLDQLRRYLSAIQ